MWGRFSQDWSKCWRELIDTDSEWNTCPSQSFRMSWFWLHQFPVNINEPQFQRAYNNGVLRLSYSQPPKLEKTFIYHWHLGYNCVSKCPCMILYGIIIILDHTLIPMKFPQVHLGPTGFSQWKFPTGPMPLASIQWWQGVPPTWRATIACQSCSL